MRSLHVILLMLLLGLACSKDKSTASDNGDDGNGDNGGVYKYLAFNITCSRSDNIERPHIADVMIFDELSGQRLILGGTGPNGYFCSSRKYDCSKKYRIEIFQLPDSYCVMAVWDIGCSDDPILWVDHYGDPSNATFFIGDCDNPAAETGCLGDSL